MPSLRIACYNIAWFTRLFNHRSQLILDRQPSAIRGVDRTRQAEAIALVLRAVDADCVAVIEAPNTGRRKSCVTQLQNFASHFGLRQSAALVGFESHTRQEIALLFDPARLTAEHSPVDGGADAPRFDRPFIADLDRDGEEGNYLFSKPPLEAMVADHETGLSFRMIAVHLKSKGPEKRGTEAEKRQRGLANRAKQYAQATWLRARLKGHLAAREPVVTLGDFNDGPGMDPLERVSGRSSVEMVAGDPARPEAMLRHPFNGSKIDPAMPRATARFYKARKRRHLHALLDFVMLSPDLAARTRPAWRIWHAEQDAELAHDGPLRQALLDASDHFPVSVDLDLGGVNGRKSD